MVDVVKRSEAEMIARSHDGFNFCGRYKEEREIRKEPWRGTEFLNMRRKCKIANRNK